MGTIRDNLKNRFKNGDKPNQDDFAALIDSAVIVPEDGINPMTDPKTKTEYINITKKLGFGVVEEPKGELDVIGNVNVSGSISVQNIKTSENLEVNGKITSPQFRITEVIKNAAPGMSPMLITGNFKSSGGVLLVFFSASHALLESYDEIGTYLQIDDCEKIFISWKHTKIATGCMELTRFLVFSNIKAAENHKVSLTAYAYDSRNRYNVTVIELPFQG